MKQDVPNRPEMSIEENKPLISFIVFAYNQEKFIREAIESAYSQTYMPLEIILSDDCSSDRTFDIMKEMAVGYKGSHKVILNRNQVNMGVGAHLYYNYELSSGELLVIAAGDDISMPHRAECIYNTWMSFNRPLMICSGWKKIEGGGEAKLNGK